MIRRCNIAIYYRLIVYSNIKDVLFGRKAVARETMMLPSELKVICRQAEGFSSWWQNYTSCMSRAESGPEFHDNSGSGSGWVTSLSGRVGSDKENWTHVQLIQYWDTSRPPSLLNSRVHRRYGQVSRRRQFIQTCRNAAHPEGTAGRRSPLIIIII